MPFEFDRLYTYIYIIHTSKCFDIIHDVLYAQYVFFRHEKTYKLSPTHINFINLCVVRYTRTCAAVKFPYELCVITV